MTARRSGSPGTHARGGPARVVAAARDAVERLVRAFDRADREGGGAWLAGLEPAAIHEAAGVVVLRLAALAWAEARGLRPPGSAADIDPDPTWAGLLRRFGPWSASSLFRPGRHPWLEAADGLDRAAAEIVAVAPAAGELGAFDVEILGSIYEGLLDRTAVRAEGLRLIDGGGRRRSGAHYTPPRLVAHVLHETLGPRVDGRSRAGILGEAIVDIACGSGAFLLGACRFLADRLATADDGADPVAARRAVAESCLHGVDRDPIAVDLARLSLWLLVGDPSWPLDFLDGSIRCGDALRGPDRPDSPLGAGPDAIDWPRSFPVAIGRGGFDAVIGNPPWGQKRVDDGDLKRFVRRHYESCGGIHDRFRPFVERGVRLLRPGGSFGMVLPEILLRKDYPGTRRFLLEQLALDAIHAWGEVFPGVVMEVATLAGRKLPPAADHPIRMGRVDLESADEAQVLQSSLAVPPAFAFHAHPVAGTGAGAPAVGDFFEIHEGVHSGNIRRDLFVDVAIDETCRELYFGRDEIMPYCMTWKGRYLRLGALPAVRTRARYANVGHADWFERDKLLVRRTGDYLLAAPDLDRRYASNNMFVVFPRPDREPPLGLFGLCAWLNSAPLTWLFRRVGPSEHRSFAELKIRHLAGLPLPRPDQAGECRALDDLGERRAFEARSGLGPVPSPLDRAIDTLVAGMLGLDPAAFPAGLPRPRRSSAAKSAVVTYADSEHDGRGRPHGAEPGPSPDRGVVP